MARVHRLEHVERLGATRLPDDHAVGTHAERVAHELANLDLARAFDVRRPRLERAHMGLPEAKLLGVLDGDDALVLGDEGRHDVQQRRLAGTGTAGDHHVECAAHARVEEVRNLRRHRVEVDEVVDRVRILGEAPDREERSADRDRVDHRVDAGAIGQARVDHR